MNSPIKDPTTQTIHNQAKAYARDFTAYLIRDGYAPTGFHTYTLPDGEPIYWKVRLRHDSKGKTLRAFARNDNRTDSKGQPYTGQFMPCEPRVNGCVYILRVKVKNPCTACTTCLIQCLAWLVYLCLLSKVNRKPMHWLN